MMDALNISKAILSVTSPGTHLIPGDRALARKVTRECNDFAADLKRRRRDRFGFWASLPLPDVEGSIEELHRALDHLNADGVALLTNHHGIYLGDPSFDHLFYELNARKVTVFIHPTAPCRVLDYGLQTAVPLCQHPYPVYEFIFEDARGIMNLFLSGTVEKYPDIKYVISHAGGAFAPLIERFSTLPGLIEMDVPESLNSASVRETLSQRFYFDLAGFPFPDQIYGLLPWLSKKRLLYGSDFPYTPLSGVMDIAESIDEGLPEVYPDASDRDAIYYRNAQELLSQGPVRHRGAGRSHL